MNPDSFPLLSSRPPAAAIQTREELDAVIENIVRMQLERNDLDQARDAELASVRQKYHVSLIELDRLLAQEIAWVETWTRGNIHVLNSEHFLDCAHARIGFHSLPPRVERASRKWTWAEASLKLAEVADGDRYLRVPSPEVDKEAILADREKFSAEEWRQLGIKIIEGERFFIESQATMDTSPVSTWSEAA